MTEMIERVARALAKEGEMPEHMWREFMEPARAAIEAMPKSAKPKAMERSIELVARQLASFRLGLDCDDPHAYNDNEKLMAGHIVGNLLANGLINEMPGEWVRVEGDPDLLNQSSTTTKQEA